MAWSKTLTSNDFPQSYDDWTVELKIKLFEDQVLGWQLLIADDIINVNADKNPHAGFAVLSMLLSYFEMIGKYIEGYAGQRGSLSHFKIGITHVFNNLEEKERIINVLYEDARCGMYHEALMGKRIILTRQYDSPIYAVDENFPIIAIDPHSLTTSLIQHFKSYIEHLKSADQEDPLLQNFLKRFDFLKRGKADLQRNLTDQNSQLFS